MDIFLLSLNHKNCNFLPKNVKVCTKIQLKVTENKNVQNSFRQKFLHIQLLQEGIFKIFIFGRLLAVFIYLTYELLIINLYHSSGQKTGPFILNARYRCSHNTRYQGTSDMKTVHRFNPSKQRSKNTSCPFFLTVKVKRQVNRVLINFDSW